MEEAENSEADAPAAGPAADPAAIALALAGAIRAQADAFPKDLGMGRFGSIVGSLVGGALLGLGWGFGAILGILAIPALFAAIAIVFTRPVTARAAAPQLH
jgi:hypothetical protein